MLSPDDTQQLLQAGSARALADAAAFIRRRLSADGSSDGSDGDWAASERQWAALIDWASDGEKNLPLDFPSPEREGGREHDVTLHERSGRWIKYTNVRSRWIFKCNCIAWCPALHSHNCPCSTFQQALCFIVSCGRIT